MKIDETCYKLNLDEEHIIIFKNFVKKYEEKIMNKKGKKIKDI